MSDHHVPYYFPPNQSVSLTLFAYMANGVCISLAEKRDLLSTVLLLRVTAPVQIFAAIESKLRIETLKTPYPP